MRCPWCCVVLYTRNPNRRSTILLVTLACMLIYILQYDVVYPYEFSTVLDIESYTDSTEPAPVGHDPPSEHNMSCPHCTLYPVSGVALDIGFKCVKTSTRPSTTVCIFDEWSDMYISHDLQYTGTWEPQVLKDFQEILGRNHAAGVIDLGANIGFYTLIAAQMGHKVFAVEPSRESIYRIHRALYLEQLGDQVYVLENGVSDTRGEVTLRLSGNNQGDHRLKENVRPCSGARCPAVINTIVLDDLYSVIGSNFTTAILKMDVQGYEHRAFQHAEILFDNIHIDYIFMEWFLMTEHYVDVNHTSTDRHMVEQMLVFLFSHDFRPYSLTIDGGKPLDPAAWQLWPFDIIWNRMPDDIEKRTIMSSHFRNWPP